MGDDVDDLNDRNYGDNNVMPKRQQPWNSCFRIIAAKRNNNIGVKWGC